MDLIIDWGKEIVRLHGANALAGVLILVVGWAAAKLLTRALAGVLRRAQLDATAASFIANLAYVGGLALVVVTALDRFGFPTVSFAAVLGAAGLAVGLALKGTLSHLASGVILIALRPFNVGDRIDAGGIHGEVIDIQVFATTLRTDDGKRIFVPNAKLTAGHIVCQAAT